MSGGSPHGKPRRGPRRDVGTDVSTRYFVDRREKVVLRRRSSGVAVEGAVNRTHGDFSRFTVKVTSVGKVMVTHFTLQVKFI